MVWTKHDFEREVRRQLVEIASIRKRLPEASDLLPRINLLEASHKSILRKLKEFRDRPARGGPGDPAPRHPPGPAPRHPTGPAPAKGAAKPRRPAARGLFDLRSLAREARPPRIPHRPGVRGTCPSCGQSLANAVPAVDVIYHNDAWYHRRCAARSGLN